MTDKEKIAMLRTALAPFADLLEYPDELNETIELMVDPKDVSAAHRALLETEN